MLSDKFNVIYKLIRDFEYNNVYDGKSAHSIRIKESDIEKLEYFSIE